VKNVSENAGYRIGVLESPYAGFINIEAIIRVDQIKLLSENVSGVDISVYSNQLSGFAGNLKPNLTQIHLLVSERRSGSGASQKEGCRAIGDGACIVPFQATRKALLDLLFAAPEGSAADKSFLFRFLEFQKSFLAARAMLGRRFRER
jgi:hypothetical protein